MALETMTKLAAYTVSTVGGESSVTFSNIPQGYTDLVVKVSARDTANNGGMYMRLNGTTTGYTAKGFYGSGSAAASENLTNGALLINPGGNTANVFSNTEITISKYSLNNYKAISCDAVSENNATSTYSEIFGELWSNSSPVTSLVFSAVSGNLAQHSSFTLYGVKNAQKTAGNSIKATGGNITFDGTYVYHVFNATSIFAPSQSVMADVLAVAGGGGGGRTGGGGGAGGVVYYPNYSFAPSSYTCTVGAGGAGNDTDGQTGTSGGNSSLVTVLTATGGGGGGSYSANGASGGSGGGAGSFDGGTKTGGSSSQSAITGATVYGNAGGSSTNRFNGGGGGAGGAGGNGSGSAAGAGGVGTSVFSSWGVATGSGQNVSGTYYFAGGGGGSASANSNNGAGGYGGGGAGSGNNPTLGTANTGGGGGGGVGAASPVSGGVAGGSGVVIIRYKG